MRSCRECGCTNEQACLLPLGLDHALGVAPTRSDLLNAIRGPDGKLYLPCAWVEDDLCSACAPGAGSDWQHPITNDRERIPSP